jgi:hypothetical protein
VPHALALAVDRALALDPRERYADALAMEVALEDGARGIAPDAPDPTVALGETQATQMLEPATGELPARPRPRMIPAPPRAPDPAPVAREPEPRRSGARTTVVTLLILAILAAGAAAVAITASNTKNGPSLGADVTRDDVQSSVDAMKGFIDDNTK